MKTGTGSNTRRIQFTVHIINFATVKRVAYEFSNGTRPILAIHTNHNYRNITTYKVGLLFFSFLLQGGSFSFFKVGLFLFSRWVFFFSSRWVFFFSSRWVFFFSSRWILLHQAGIFGTLRLNGWAHQCGMQRRISAPFPGLEGVLGQSTNHRTPFASLSLHSTIIFTLC